MDSALLLKPFERLQRTSDVFIAVGILTILFVMLIPIPPTLLDFFFATNIALSLSILLVVMYVMDPSEFHVFPSLLLVTTLFRLSLNIASTRLILLHGDEGSAAAGKIIEAFGKFVVGGSYVVGAVVFIVIIIINLVVITRGATRIAEVAARFTLDALPGKQMSIDADLNAGLITEEEANRRRQKLQREADFYGAMDGASKFVRGDITAGLLITMINIVGGLVIGVLQKGMPIQEALKTYTILTIGDGLVSQIPSLIISVATGILVSRAAAEADLGRDMIVQLVSHPKAAYAASGVLFAISLAPGIPFTPLFALSAVLFLIGYGSQKAAVKRAMEEEMEKRKKAKKKAEPEKVESLLPIDILELEIGYELIPMVDPEKDGELLERIKSLRRQLALEMGFVVPPIRIRDNIQLKPNEYSILIKGVEVERGSVHMDKLLVMAPGGEEPKIEGIKTKDPVFGIPAVWIDKKLKEKAQAMGYTVVDPVTVVSTHLAETIKKHAHEILTRQDVQNLLDALSKNYPKVVEELVPNQLTLGGVQKVLQNLLREGVSIRDMLTIVEALADYAPLTKDPDVLTEYVRQRLGRSIVKKYLVEGNKLPVVTFTPQVEELLSKSLKSTEAGTYLAIEPSMMEKLIENIKKGIQKLTMMGYHPVLLTSPIVRLHIKRLTERDIPELVVLSTSEIPPEVNIQSFASIGV